MSTSTTRPGSAATDYLVRPDELFFSTTDHRGLIRTGNSVFSRISGYAVQELIGAPHSIVRHPDMPAGAFRLMWDRLLAGRPMAAYVQNLAKDGKSYWVFATVTPLDDGFLSVRTSPSSGLFQAARALYAEVRQFEREISQRDGRIPAPQVAAAGAEQIERRLRRLGFASYDDFMLEALPAEVAARGPLVRTAFARPGATGPNGDILRAAHAIDLQLEGLVRRLDTYGALAEDLVASAQTVLENSLSLRGAVRVAQDASADVAEQAPVLLNVAQVMAAPMTSAVDALEQLAPRLEELRDVVRQLRSRISLAQLHTDMVAAFAAETVDGDAPTSGAPQVAALCDALGDGVQSMAGATHEVNARLHEVAIEVTTAGALLDDFRSFLGQWRILVFRHRQAAPLRTLVAPIDELLDAGHDQQRHLRELARSCTQAMVTLDAEAVDELVYRIRSAATHAESSY